MLSKGYFVRDPREIPFLEQQAKSLLVLAESCGCDVQVKDDDDFGFMAMQFLYKQMHHSDSVFRLIPTRDSGLIARTMIDGLYQILWASHAPQERGRLWRSFAIVHDWRLIQGRLREGLQVDPQDILKNEAGLQEFGDLHRTNKPRAHVKEPYNKYWRGAVSLSDMATITGRDLYDGPYSELSDWEHWGVSGIGESISRSENHVVVNHTSERITGLALLATFQCLFQTLEVVEQHLSLGIADTLQEIYKEFVQTMDSYRGEAQSPQPAAGH